MFIYGNSFDLHFSSVITYHFSFADRFLWSHWGLSVVGVLVQEFECVAENTI